MNVENAMRVPWPDVEQGRIARRCDRTAVTLIELLIAIAIVAMMLTIVAPNVLGQLDERRFESAGDVLLQQLLLARAHAQTAGEAVEVRYVPGVDGTAGRVESRVLILDVLEQWPEEDAEGSAEARSGLEDGQGGVSREPSTIYESWALQELPAGYCITETEPAAADVRRMPGNEVVDPLEPGASALTTESRRDDGDVLRIALFLQDGSAIAHTPQWLVDDAQRAAKISINSWTGLASLERVERADDDRAMRPIDTLRDEQ